MSKAVMTRNRYLAAFVATAVATAAADAVVAASWSPRCSARLRRLYPERDM